MTLGNFLRSFKSIVFLLSSDKTIFLCWLGVKIFYVCQPYPLFPISRYCNHIKNSVYVHISTFYVCSTFQNPWNENYFRHTVGGPMRRKDLCFLSSTLWQADEVVCDLLIGVCVLLLRRWLWSRFQSWDCNSLSFPGTGRCQPPPWPPRPKGFVSLWSVAASSAWALEREQEEGGDIIRVVEEYLEKIEKRRRLLML